MAMLPEPQPDTQKRLWCTFGHINHTHTTGVTSMPKPARTEFERRMTLAVAGLREGEVVSFGQVAARAGKPNAPRAAGRFLSSTSNQLPWWRVVYANGKLPPCNPQMQAVKLTAEGVVVENNRVVSAPVGTFNLSETPALLLALHYLWSSGLSGC